MILLVTIWALGICMIALAGIIYLPKRLILVLSLAIIAGHNLLDGINAGGNTLGPFGWALLRRTRDL